MSKDPKRMSQTLPSEPKLSTIAKSPYLMILAGNRVGEMFKLEGEFTIGRDPQCTLFLIDEGVSRQHIRVAMSAAGVVGVIDLGSTNGTFVNGTQVRCPARW